MADQTVASDRSGKAKTDNASATPGNGKARNRKVYAHVMSDKEKFALQVLLKAKNALSAVAVHVQEGKGCNPEVLQAALMIQSNAAAVLFGE